MKTDRLIGILSILLQEEKTTAPELAEKFEVSRRTINRDIEDLCKAGIPIRTAQGTGGGISIMDGYRMDRTILTSKDMQMILAGLRSLDSVSGNRYSYLHPGRKKYITERNLGTRYTEDFLLKAFEENTKSHREQKEEILEQQSPNTSTDLPTVPFSDTSAISTPFIFIKSDLRLVIDLQTCIKAQQSGAYAQKVKLTNLKQMAQTVAYIQEHGYDSLDDFHVELNQASDQTSAPRKSLKDTEQQLKDVNEQIEKVKDL